MLRECPNPPSWPPSLAVRPEHCSVHSDFPSLARHTSLSPHHPCSLYQEAPLVLTSKPPQSHIPCPCPEPHIWACPTLPHPATFPVYIFPFSSCTEMPVWSDENGCPLTRCKALEDLSMRTPLCLSHPLDWLSECIFPFLSFRANLTSSLWLSEGCLTIFFAALISPERTRGSLHLLVGISAPSQASRRENFKQILEGDCICSLAVSSYSGFTLGFLSDSGLENFLH